MRAPPLALVPLAVLALALLAGGFGVGPGLRPAPAQAAPASCPYSGGGPPFLMQSFEADRARTHYLDALTLAAANALFPDDPDFQLPPLSVGAERIDDLGATIPPQILYAIAWIESAINQAAIHVPYGQLGPALVSFDCGYGIMQVTSSIVHDGGLPSRYEALVGTHFAYNIAAGARILAEKWNEPLYPIVGEHDPQFVESWYYALWAYNGWAGVNHPQNPIYDPLRPPYDCRGRANDYPYQERVLGCIANPPEVDGQRLWEPLPVVLPDLSTLAQDGGPLNLDTFYAGLDTIYIHVGDDTLSPFDTMHIPLPDAALPRPPPADLLIAQIRTRLLGAPQPRLDTAELELTSSQLESGAAPLTIHNDGSGLLAWRVIDAPSWLTLDLTAGAALAAGTEFGPPQPAQLNLTAATSGVPEGEHQGTIQLEFHTPDGRAHQEIIPVSLDKQGAAFYEAGRPQS